MSDLDLQILALPDAKVLPFDVQSAFDHWRIWQARDAVVGTIRRRLGTLATDRPFENLRTLHVYLERLEAADTEETVFEGIYAVAEAVEAARTQLGLHSNYIVLIMSGHLNPWGLLEFNGDFENPSPSVVAATKELWRIVEQHNLDIQPLLAQIDADPTLNALNEFYENRQAAATTTQIAPAVETEDPTITATLPVVEPPTDPLIITGATLRRDTAAHIEPTFPKAIDPPISSSTATQSDTAAAEKP